MVVGTHGGGGGLYVVSLNPVQCRAFQGAAGGGNTGVRGVRGGGGGGGGGSKWFSYLLGSAKFPSVSALVPGPRRSNYSYALSSFCVLLCCSSFGLLFFFFVLFFFWVICLCGLTWCLQRTVCAH